MMEIIPNGDNLDEKKDYTYLCLCFYSFINVILYSIASYQVE